MRKLSCFFLAFVLFFNMSFYSFAEDITLESGDYSFPYVDRAQFDFFNGSSVFQAYNLSAYSYGGRTFIVPREYVLNSTVYLLNPDALPVYYGIYGSSYSTVLDNISRPSSGNNFTKNNISNVSFLYADKVANTSLSRSLDFSNLPDYDFYYVSVAFSGTAGLKFSVDFTLFSRSNSPAVTPSASPSALPSASPSGSPLPGSGTLEDYTFWATCYNQTWKNGSSAKSDVAQRFVPSSMSDFSSDSNGIYSYVYTYPVRIPFRVECSNFLGEGFFDASFRFGLSCKIMGLKTDGTDGISYLIDYSTPWVECVDSISFNAAGGSNYGFAMDVINVPLHAGTSAELYYCMDVYVCLYSNHQFTGFGDYIDVNLSNISFDILSSLKVSDNMSGTILDKINDNILAGNEQDKQFHDEELEEANKAIDQMQDSVGELTGVLSKWEIVTMPITFVKDFAGAITSEGSTGLTFPSFTLMGYELWPSYTFDLEVIKDKFPLLYNSLHLITGIMVVGWFLHYLWRKWHLLTGDDTPEV